MRLADHVSAVRYAWFTWAGAGRIGKGVRVAELPSGTVTFLFSDLEVSTRLWEQHHDAMIEARARYFDLVDGAVETCGGVVFSHAGDGVAAVFTSASDALRAAVAATACASERSVG